MQNNLTTPEQLQERVSALSDRIDILKSTLRGKSDRMKELEELLRMLLTHSYLMICFRCLMQMIWNFGKKSVNGKILTMTNQRNIFSPILIPISSPNRCRPTVPNTISGLTKPDISV